MALANLASVVMLFMSGLGISNAHRRLYWGHWGFAPDQAWARVMKFPDWLTIPGHFSLAEARLWHLAMAWPFAFALLAFMVASLVNGHFRRDLVIGLRELRWASLKADIIAHLRFDFAHGGAKFNLLQKLAYAGVIFLALPLMIATGLAMSPGMDANWPWLLDVFGGRQSARSLHFLCAFALAGFMALHVVLVLLSGPIRQVRDMITGGKA